MRSSPNFFEDHTQSGPVPVPRSGPVSLIRTRDVTFKDNLIYDPAELDIGILLKDEVEDMIISLDVPEIPSHTRNNKNQFLELESGPEISENASENTMLIPQWGEASASDLPRK